MKKPTRTTILFLLLGIIASLLLIAKTDLMTPVMRFILATDQGTPLQLIGCVVAGILGFRLAFVLLNVVGSYYADELETIEKNKLSRQGGEHP
jgi:hypothetical protein